MTLLAPLPQPVLLADDGSDDLFPVLRVFCVGRNYADHVKEMGRHAGSGAADLLHQWAEDVVPGRIGGALSAKHVRFPFRGASWCWRSAAAAARSRSEAALDHVLGYAAGLDMTRRDLQKKSTGPWDTGKNFEAAAPVGSISLASEVGHPSAGSIRTIVNGDVRQDADLAEMIWPVPDIIAFLSRFYRIEAGDLVFTGTPAGVGPVIAGDKVRVEIAGLTPLEVTIG